MQPFYFGSAERSLFGLYTPSRGRSHRDLGALLCYPMGAEYMRAHRAFRQLGTLLNRQGFHVLRFDYFGTGDSAGEGTEATVEQWLEDVDAEDEEGAEDGPRPGEDVDEAGDPAAQTVEERGVEDAAIEGGR